MDRYFSKSDIIPNFLKIDVEGFEQNVIQGGEEFLKENKPIVVLEMNHFCLDVLHRITIPDFLDFLRTVFPVLHAVDSDNATIIDLHDKEMAYFVMYEHVVHHRFPNIVGGFDATVKDNLEVLAKLTPEVTRPAGTIQVRSAPSTALSGEHLNVSVTINNRGTEDWLGYGTRPVRLSYHWINDKDEVIVHDGMRTELKNQIVRPGESILESVNVMAPTEKGEFKLVVTVVQENVCWFEDRGFLPECIAVKVM